jgi:hypothetical protein
MFLYNSIFENNYKEKISIFIFIINNVIYTYIYFHLLKLSFNKVFERDRYIYLFQNIQLIKVSNKNKGFYFNLP